MLVSILVVMAGISLSDAKVHDLHRLISQPCGVGKAAVKAELRTDHDSVVVELYSASLVAH